jgi:hypothetical protein
MTNKLFFHMLAFVFLGNLFAIAIPCAAKKHNRKTAISVRTAIVNDKLSVEWKDALRDRMSKYRIDSFGNLQRPLSTEEEAWKKMIGSKAAVWNTYRDSLAIPFENISMPDTITVLLGYFGDDDGFTYIDRTVCLDLTALYRAYGKADIHENNNRIDRIFAHEYTHLLHKHWHISNWRRISSPPVIFKDSILWECWYEGVGMYRSLNPKWLPANDTLPSVTILALKELYPIFTERLTTMEANPDLPNEEKVRLNMNLSRGPVNKKWGAFPVAIWLALETRGNHSRLTYWIKRGPRSVIDLAKKYLTGEDKKKFDSFFP